VSDGVGRPPVADIEVRARLGRGGSPPKVVTEPVLIFEDVRTTVEGVVSCGIRGEQVAKAGLGRGGVCARGLACAPVVLYIPPEVGRRRVGTVSYA
jgi:hypothetical protein